jgi:hypothetical protein
LELGFEILDWREKSFRRNPLLAFLPVFFGSTIAEAIRKASMVED